MSLVRLLKAGKSLTDLRNSTSRYRMRSGFLLPKFGSTKNPFTAPVPVEVIQAAAEGAPVVARYQKSPAELSAARMKKTAKLPETAAPELPSVPRPEPGPQWTSQLGVWAQKINPLKLWKRRSITARPEKARRGRPPVQAELSLDNIKVIRNDLNDAEVDLVPVKRPAENQAAPVKSKERSAVGMTPALVEIQPG